MVEVPVPVPAPVDGAAVADWVACVDGEAATDAGADCGAEADAEGDPDWDAGWWWEPLTLAPCPNWVTRVRVAEYPSEPPLAGDSGRGALGLDRRLLRGGGGGGRGRPPPRGRRRALGR